MLNKKFKKELSDALSTKNVDGLFCFMENSGVKYYKADLRGPLALATLYGVYVDVEQIKVRGLSEKLMYFIILHETAHMKRMKKIGKKRVLKNLSNDDFEKFFDHVLYEEIFADRYGCFLYYQLNKEVYPKQMTQQLTNELVAQQYKVTARALFGKINNDENNYKELMNSFIKKKY